MVYGVDVMFPIEINMPTQRHTQFNEEEDETKLRCEIDMVEETREIVHIRESFAK